MTSLAYCPQCGQQRVSALRYCSRCGFDFETVRFATSGAVTSLTRSPAQAHVGPASAERSRVEAHPNQSADQPNKSADQPNQLVPILAGVAWLIGAAAIGYLAFLQLEYSGLGLADADEAQALALWNGLTAAITAYLGAMAILSPTRKRMGAAVIWGVINVAWGGYQVSQGVSHPAFVAALVAFGVGGVLALAAWSQLRSAGVGRA